MKLQKYSSSMSFLAAASDNISQPTNSVDRAAISQQCYYANSPGIPLGSCWPGFYCPNSTINDPSTSPVACPASFECQHYRLLSRSCPPQGPYEPTLCLPGYYCPNSHEQIRCPKEYYCPSGTVTPIKCDFLSSCPEGTKLQKTYTGIATCAVVDVLLLLCFLGARFYEIKREKARWTELLSGWMHFKMMDRSSSSTLQETPKRPSDDRRSSNSSRSHISAASQQAFAELTQTWQQSLGGCSLRLDFSFKDMGLQLPSGKLILQGVTGEIKSSRMTAIMGPSGAGKTTFMNVLCGKVARNKGNLYINGQRAEIPEYKKIIGYVPQEDIMLRELTVRENVLHSARCRLPRSWTHDQIEKHVDDILRALNLLHVVNTVIGDEHTRGISGGQRKRVNVALELAAVPLCLFLDEPTSGLDSTAALDLADILCRIARLGLTIVAVIHQPRIEIFRKFDDVLMIALGGRTAYHGPVSTARSYFQRLGFEFDPQANEADVLMDILAGKGTNAIADFDPSDLADLWLQYDRQQHVSDCHLVEEGSSSMPGPSQPHDHGSINPNENQHAIVHVDTQDSVPVKHKPRPINMPKINPKFSRQDAEEITLMSPQNARRDPEGRVVEGVHLEMGRLSKERGASLILQAYYCHNRSVLQQYRLFSTLLLEIFVGLFAGLLMGQASAGVEFVGVFTPPYILLSSAPIYWIMPLVGLLIGTTVALASGASAISVFSEERTVFWREAAAGHSRVGYYLGKTIATFYRIILASLHFASLYYYLAEPTFQFLDLYPVVLLSYFGVYGMAAVVSMLVGRENARLLSVIVNLFVAVFCGYGPTLVQAQDWGLLFIWELSWNKWATEAIVDRAMASRENVYDVQDASDAFGYTLGRYSMDVCMMLAIGVIARCIALVLLLVMHKDRQR